MVLFINDSLHGTLSLPLSLQVSCLSRSMRAEEIAMLHKKMNNVNAPIVSSSNMCKDDRKCICICLCVHKFHVCEEKSKWNTLSLPPSRSSCLCDFLTHERSVTCASTRTFADIHTAECERKHASAEMQ